MSTERKPGSRGVTSAFSGNAKKKDVPFGAAPATEPNERKKGSTKTKSGVGFKKRKKK